MAKKLCSSYEASLGMRGVMIMTLNHREKRTRFRHFHIHVIPRYKLGAKRDPINIKPKQNFSRETDLHLNQTLTTIKSHLNKA